MPFYVDQVIIVINSSPAAEEEEGLGNNYAAASSLKHGCNCITANAPSAFSESAALVRAKQQRQAGRQREKLKW